MPRFTEKFAVIASVLSDVYQCHIDESNYDGFIVKRLSATNCLHVSSTSKQTHIAITGNQMDLFPYIYSKSFIENQQNEYKNYFVLRVDVNIYKDNCDPFFQHGIDFKNNLFLTEKMCVYPRRNGDQIQLSMIQNGDSANFLLFRRLFSANDYLVFLKRNELLVYDAFIIESKYLSTDFSSVIELYKENAKHITFVENQNIVSNTTNRNEFPHNQIFFGAPGTGKSYQLNKQLIELLGENSKNFERVTFHPDYSYAQFVGTYKPVPTTDDDGKETITYKYVPGPFMRSLVSAYKNPSQDFVLVIEEINRANMAAVFGDIFQLLDRNENGFSEYSIQTNEDMRTYLSENLNKEIFDFSSLQLPSNLFIWATMNSADQGVFPMDTAFKRRWNFKYLGIDENEQGISDKYVTIAGKKIYWNKLRKSINNYLISKGINEDKLLGPYFISKTIICPIDTDEINTDQFISTFSNKVLMYLFEDAARHLRRELFSGCHEHFNHYSKICEEFIQTGIEIFDKQIVTACLTDNDFDENELQQKEYASEE